MSNYVSSTTTISRDEYRRLQAASAEATSLRHQVNVLSGENGALQTALNAANGRIEAAQREFGNIWNELENQNAANAARNQQLQAAISEAYRNCNDRISAHAERVQQSLGDLREEVGELVVNSIEANNRIIEDVINRNNEAITDMIGNLRTETQTALSGIRQELGTVQDDLDVLYNGADVLLDAARDYQDQINTLRAYIEQTRHEILLPGQYAAVLAQIRIAEEDINTAAGNPMNAAQSRASARTAFEETLRFMEEIAIAEQEWQSQLAVTEQLATILEAQIENSRTVEPRPGIHLDVDYWSKDGVSENRRAFETMREVLKNPRSLTAQQLIDMQNAFLEISRDVDGVVADALVAVNASQNIVRNAERLRRAFRKNGNMQVISHTYEGDDKRGNYRCILRNDGTGLTVVVTVSVEHRDGDAVISNEADIVDYGTMSANEAEVLVREVLGGMSGGTENVHCSGHNEILHPERRNIAQWERGNDVQRKA